MSDHSRAFVPLDVDVQSSPELKEQGRRVDVGLLAEALLYYDRILFNVANPHLFTELINWFLERGFYAQLIDLLRKETLQVYYYAFYTLPLVHPNGVIDLRNINDQVMIQPNSFEKRFLNFEGLRPVFSSNRQFEKFCEVLDGKVIEVKAEEFGLEGINNAWSDFLNPRRSELIMQEILDELYRLKSLGSAPTVKAHVRPGVSRQQLNYVSWNINFEDIAKRLGPTLAFSSTLPLSVAAIGNKTIWSASRLGCDLYLPSPISSIVGDKLYEAEKRIVKTQRVIDQLESEVEFPDLRRLVNEDQITFEEVLSIRKKSKKFRGWLQSGANRDRNALLAYHHEVAKESGFTKAGRKVLKLFGDVGGGAAGAVVGAVISEPVTGAAIGGAVGGALSYIFDLGEKLGADWKPVVFGDWYKDRIAKLLNKQSKHKRRVRKKRRH